MTTRCSECGAIFAGEETCTDRFNVTQSREFENPAYFRVHHLSVPCYLLQHNRYARQGWFAARRLLHDIVSLNLSQEEAYRRSTTMLDNRQRQWQFTKGAKLNEVQSIVWRWTLADVRFERAEQYCGDVQQWVKAVLDDTAPLVQARNASA